MLTAIARNVVAGLLIAATAQTASFSSADARPPANTFKALDSDSADRSCQVIMRSAGLKKDSSTGLPVIETDANGQSWYTFESLVDAAESPLSTGTSVFLLYKSAKEFQWHSAPGMPVTGANFGLQRVLFRVAEGTLPAQRDLTVTPAADSDLQVIAYLQTTDGRRIFDHNTSTGSSESIALGARNSWTFSADPALCPVSGKGSSTIRFLKNWLVEQKGKAQPAQSLFVEYDLSRLPQCQTSSYNGLPAWQTDAMIRFLPGGEEFSASLNSLQNGKMVESPARFEIPADSTHAQLWFKSRGRNCEAVWDSNYGRNYEISIKADVAPSPSWAGQWRKLTGSGQCIALNKTEDLPDVAAFFESDLKSCQAVEAEVLVPGLTTAVESDPDSLMALVVWSIDGQQQRPQWLTFSGRSGQNYRFRWQLPTELLRQIPWSKIDYSFQFSTDGVFWLNSGRASSNNNGRVTPRTLEYRQSL
jgi:hypothetical protein